MTNHTARINLEAYIDAAQTHQGNLREGDRIVSFRGESWTFLKVTRPAEPGRQAKVLVKNDQGQMEFYASVFPGLEVL